MITGAPDEAVGALLRRFPELPPVFFRDAVT